MPRSVHVKVRNCAIASSTFAVMSWSGRMAIEVNARATATTNELAEMDFSNLRVILFFFLELENHKLSYLVAH